MACALTDSEYSAVSHCQTYCWRSKLVMRIIWYGHISDLPPNFSPFVMRRSPDLHRCRAYRNYAFQLMDQDSPSQPIKSAYQITENLSGYNPACTAANSADCPPQVQEDATDDGIIADTHGRTHSAGVCLALNENVSLNQIFTVTVAGTQQYNLKTACHVSFGNFSDTLNETTSCQDSQ
jgi:hypothetical protein